MKNQKNIKHKLFLKWRKQFGEHKAFTWVEAKIKDLDWTYGVDATYNGSGYTAWVELYRHAEPIRVLKKCVATQEEAQLACENHLINYADKLQNFISKNKVK